MSEKNPVWAALDAHLPAALKPLDAVEQWDADRKVIRAMLKFGGGFVVCLGEAALHADKDNLDRIKKAWPEYWAKYAEMANRMPKEEP